MNEQQIKILKTLAEDTEMCFFTRHVVRETGLVEAVVKAQLTALRISGYVELVRGLVSDEGPGYRGSGYRILPIGERLLRDYGQTQVQ